ncbi:anti-sigma factor RsiW [Rhizobium tibeticum]|uniref:Putative transmembrane transcriptional regulator (Anti-sigma factor) n=1 Tax=Rhizobium tibeticum TaxID=501024 RepID=A0A1H8RD91_9HYPH|nr:anti-sigma factor [Rhizobium tibeticum]MDP9809555.1 anti-sigma factor RsiW [Rhizobium tibeticum]SEI07266.1 putative transmembrane transcriptional regulator (anti-sigma factor) [Rhizobium tibeticum]SEO64415.1 Transmembrane transcriptional regulator (anti-sigma factor RsiW) [Rhizobium tibeticum]
MNEINQTVTEADLHAYADGQLPEQARARIEAWLSDNPDDAARVAEWTVQNGEIRSLFAGYEMSRDTDVELVTGRSGRASWPKRLAMTAAIAGIFGLGALSGHYGPALFEKPDLQLTELETLPNEARNAFLVYAGEVRHPVEVFANEEAHLATWLGKRLAVQDLKVPNLQELGFKLVGGRLLPVDGRPGAMFMYEDQAGERLTVLVGRNADNRSTSFRFASSGKVETFYWIDGELGYAVTGEVSRDVLRKVAEECYRQFPS